MQAQVHWPRSGSDHLGDPALGLPDGDPADGGPGAGSGGPLEAQANRKYIHPVYNIVNAFLSEL